MNPNKLIEQNQLLLRLIFEDKHNLSINQIRDGLIVENDRLTCMVCGNSFYKSITYNKFSTIHTIITHDYRFKTCPMTLFRLYMAIMRNKFELDNNWLFYKFISHDWAQNEKYRDLIVNDDYSDIGICNVYNTYAKLPNTYNVDCKKLAEHGFILCNSTTWTIKCIHCKFTHILSLEEFNMENITQKHKLHSTDNKCKYAYETHKVPYVNSESIYSKMKDRLCASVYECYPECAMYTVFDMSILIQTINNNIKLPEFTYSPVLWCEIINSSSFPISRLELSYYTWTISDSNILCRRLLEFYNSICSKLTTLNFELLVCEHFAMMNCLLTLSHFVDELSNKYWLRENAYYDKFRKEYTIITNDNILMLYGTICNLKNFNYYSNEQILKIVKILMQSVNTFISPPSIMVNLPSKPITLHEYLDIIRNDM